MRSTKNAMSADVTTRSGNIVSARLRLVAIISTRLPTMRSGARVPMRSETCVSIFTALTSLVSRTRSRPVFWRSRLPNE